MRSILDSFNHAIEGVLFTVKTEPNFRIHLLMSLLVLIAAAVMGVGPVELTILLLTIGFVLVVELINTAIERVVDLLTSEYHPLAKIAKDVAAGAVLTAALGAVAVGYVVFFVRFEGATYDFFLHVGHFPPSMTLASLIFVLLSVIGLKRSVKPFNLRGGFPSIHTAVAFSLVTTIFWLGATPTVTFLAAGIALLVAQARVEAGFHSVFEVAAGGGLGILITTLLFQLSGR